jgi:hypothetical protein
MMIVIVVLKDSIERWFGHKENRRRIEKENEGGI